MAEKKKKASIIKQLRAEYSRLNKPTGKELWRTTGKILAFAIVGAMAIRGIDTAFGALLGLFL